MKNRRKVNPLLRIFVFLCLLVLLAAVAAIGMYYYFFSIPEPEGLSLANWPNRFTENFSVWMENEDGELKIKDIGLERLDEYGLWIQVMDESGQEIFSYKKPEHYPTNYSASALIAFATSGYENGNTIFASSYQASGEVYNYVVGFPYAIGKYMLYYNGETAGRLSPIFRMAIFFVLCVVAAAFLVYGFWLTRQMGKITRGIESISLRTYRQSQEKGIFSSICTALNKMDLEISRSDQLRENTERARQEWITNITHDLKTPLSPVRGYAELLADGAATEKQTVQEYGFLILKNVKHAEELINDLKLTYQLDSGAVPFHPKQVRLVRFLREVVIDLMNDPAFSGRDLEFESNLPEFTFAVDPGLFRRAVQNIIVNALVHNPPETKVAISIAKIQESGIHISIRDHGVGMSEEEQSNLFHRYYRGTNTKEKPEGSGLGLAIAKQIVTLHGGDIEVQSKPGEGTEFLILLPAN